MPWPPCSLEVVVNKGVRGVEPSPNVRPSVASVDPLTPLTPTPASLLPCTAGPALPPLASPKVSFADYATVVDTAANYTWAVYAVSLDTGRLRRYPNMSIPTG